jgi:hypothetical protein
MKNKKNNKVPLKVNDIKKTLKDFVADEDGFVSKETMLKVGLSTVAGIGVLGAMSDAFAGHTSTYSHGNSLNFATSVDANGCSVPGNAGHTNTVPHNSHSSY